MSMKQRQYRFAVDLKIKIGLYILEMSRNALFIAFKLAFDLIISL